MSASSDTSLSAAQTGSVRVTAEATLHGSADAAPDTAAAQRLDRLGDAVTAEAKDIDRPADELSPRSTVTPR
jgi:hypothetical protein